MDKDKCQCNLRHSETTCQCHSRTSNCSCNMRVTNCDCVARFTNETIMNDVSYKGINEYALSHGFKASGIVYEGAFHPDATLFTKKFEHLKVLIESINNEKVFDSIPQADTMNGDIEGSRCINNKRENLESISNSLGDIHKIVSELSKCSCDSRQTTGCFCQNRQFNNCTCNLHNDQLQCVSRVGSYCDCNGRCSCNQVAEYSVCSCVYRGTQGTKYKERCTCNVRNDYMGS